MHTLTARQNEVMSLVSIGLTNRGIGRRLGISTQTVKNHLYEIYYRLASGCRAEAAAIYVRAEQKQGDAG